ARRIPMCPVRHGPRQRLDLFRRVEGKWRGIRLAAPFGLLRRVRRQAVRARTCPVVEYRADELAGLVDGARHDSRARDRAQQLLDLACRHLARGPVAERSHDETTGGASPAAIRLTRLRKEAAVIPQRRGLGGLDVLEPPQVL